MNVRMLKSSCSANSHLSFLSQTPRVWCDSPHKIKDLFCIFYVSLNLRSDGYHCTGNLSEWTKCSFMTRTPKRVAFKIPKEYNDVEFLKNYKYQKRERVFNKATLAASSINHQALAGVKFFVQGKCKRACCHSKLVSNGHLLPTKQ